MGVENRSILGARSGSDFQQDWKVGLWVDCETGEEIMAKARCVFCANRVAAPRRTVL